MTIRKPQTRVSHGQFHALVKWLQGTDLDSIKTYEELAATAGPALGFDVAAATVKQALKDGGVPFISERAKKPKARKLDVQPALVDLLARVEWLERLAHSH
jgi:hypothetical protein